MAFLLNALPLNPGTLRDYRDRLVTGFEFPWQNRAPAEAKTRQGNLVEQLSERELEILRLIAIGLPNGKIAQRLYLSANTIRAHTSHIFGKLGVHNRTEAVARARELDLL